MASIKDDRGYNQMFKPSKAMEIRTERRCQYIVDQMQHVTVQTNILEIGSGTGEIANLLASKTLAHVTGSDICVPFVNEANAKYKKDNLHFIVLDFNKPECLEGKQFDYVVGNGILHHLHPHLDLALSNIRNLLSPSGKIIFLEPNIYNPYCYLIFNTTKRMRNWANLEPDEKALEKRIIYKQLEDAGYSKIKVEYKDFLLPNTPQFLIKPSIFIGNKLEKIPLLKMVSQSLFISANK